LSSNEFEERKAPTIRSVGKGEVYKGIISFSLASGVSWVKKIKEFSKMISISVMGFKRNYIDKFAVNDACWVNLPDTNNGLQGKKQSLKEMKEANNLNISSYNC